VNVCVSVHLYGVANECVITMDEYLMKWSYYCVKGQLLTCKIDEILMNELMQNAMLRLTWMRMWKRLWNDLKLKLSE
jgi:hypothetical protein